MLKNGNMKLKHVERFPAAPSWYQVELYEFNLYLNSRKLQYQTGPRHGQQLAEKRKVA